MLNLRVKIWDIRFVLALALLVWIAKVIFILSTSSRGLAMTTWIIDDAFGEIAIARNIAMGHGFTYNFVTPTTGAPFLWTYMLSVPFMLFSKNAGIQSSFVMSSFFGMLATITVFLLAKRVSGNRRTAWIAFLLSTCTANAFFEAMNGMETAMFTFVVVAACAAYMDVGMSKHTTAFKKGCIVGAILGIGKLLRGDGMFITAALAFITLIDLWQDKQHRSQQMRFIYGLVLFYAIGFVILTSWQVLRTGSATLSNQIGRHEIALAWHNFSFDHFSLIRYVQIVIWNVFQLEQLLTIAIGSSLLGLVGLVYAWTQASSRKLALITFFYTSSFFAALVGYQWYFPDLHGLRYVNPAAHIFCIFLAMLIVLVSTGRYQKLLATGLTASVIILTGYSFYNLVIHMPYASAVSLIGRPTPAQEKAFLGLFDWMRENLPKDVGVGIRDHGRPAVFSEMPIQDISGNMDPNVPLLMKQENGPIKVRDYLRQKKVEYMHIPTTDQRGDLLYKKLHEVLPLSLVEGAPPSVVPLYHIDWEKIPQ